MRVFPTVFYTLLFVAGILTLNHIQRLEKQAEERHYQQLIEAHLQNLQQNAQPEYSLRSSASNDVDLNWPDAGSAIADRRTE